MKKIDITDEILYKYAGSVEDIIISKIPNDDELEYDFSKDFENKMNKLIKKEKRYSLTKKILKGSKRIAIIFLIISVGIVTLTMNVEAVRNKVIEIINIIYTEFTEFKLKKDTVDREIELLEPNYLPKGFREVDRMDADTGNFIIYENSENLQIRYSSDIISSNSIIVDTENALVETIYIHGNEATYVIKDNNQQILWNDGDYIYWIDREFSDNNISEKDKKELIKIAENIKIK